MANKTYKYWQCNECKIMYPRDTKPDICICGNDMLVNSTKNTMTIFDVEVSNDEVEDAK